MVKGLVTIVISSYNKAQYISQCVESVLNQDYPHTEIIVVDDGSSDRSVEILKSYGGRIHLECQKTSGRYAAINRGIRLAQGEYIAVVEACNYWHPGKLSAQVAAMNANPSATAVHTGGQFVDKSGRVIDTHPAGYEWPSPPSGNIMAHIIRANCVVAASVMMRHDILRDVGLFEPRLLDLGDWHMWLRLATVGDFLYIPTELTYARIDSLSNTKRRQSFDDETWIRESAIRKNEKRLITSAEDPKEMRLALIHNEACLAGAHETLGHRKTAMGIWAHNWMRYPKRMKSLFRLLRCLVIKPQRVPIA